MSDHEVKAIHHTCVQAAEGDRFDDWKVQCSCGWVSKGSCRMLGSAGDEFDEHRFNPKPLHEFLTAPIIGGSQVKGRGVKNELRKVQALREQHL